MFSRILFYLVLLPVSYLPLGILYRVSDLLFVLLNSVFPYRKRVIEDNLRHAFPDYPEEKITDLRKKFYQHFCDIAVETIKTLTISKQALSARIAVTNPELLQSEEFKNRHTVIMAAHYANWEWAALQLSQHTPLKDVYGIYLPLKNKFFDQVIRKSRNRFGTRLVSTKDLPKLLASEIHRPSSFGFIADQNPSNLNKTLWVEFFGREVPVAKGAERYARYLDAIVVYGHVEKTGRGKYEITYELLTDNIREMQEGLLLVNFMKTVEGHIRRKPEHWLWSHKRWKHKKNV